MSKTPKLCKRTMLWACAVLLTCSASTASIAEAPKQSIDTTYPKLPADHRVLTVGGARQYGNCQEAVDAARPGDEVVIDAGFVCRPIRLPIKNGDQWVVIRTANLDKLKAEGTRATAADAANMAVIETDSSKPAVSTVHGVHHYYFVGIEFRVNSSSRSEVYQIVSLGMGDPTEDMASLLPHDITIARSYIHGHANQEVRRGVAFNGRSLAVVDSTIYEIHEHCCDSQAIAGWNGSGPFKIVNNDLQAAGENIMFGGGRIHIANLIPSDIEVRNNHLWKPLTWQASVTSNTGASGPWSVKNLFELKNAQRVVFDGNLLENNWVGPPQNYPQKGFAVQLTPRSEGNGTVGSGHPWVRVQDVNFTNNVIRHSVSGINILLADNEDILATAGRLNISNNLLYDMSPRDIPGSTNRLVQIVGTGGGQIVFDHNTMIDTDGSAMVVDSSTVSPNFMFTNNVTTAGYSKSGMAAGEPSLVSAFPRLTFTGNIIIGESNPFGRHLGPNSFPRSPTNIGFADWHACMTGKSAAGCAIVSGKEKNKARRETRDIRPGVDFQALRTSLSALGT